MNYAHVFHAGNFADVFKHALLTRILLYLNRKDSPYRVIDTHAGEGAYDLACDEADRTGEWRDGIGRLSALDRSSEAGRLLAPYLDLVGESAADGRPLVYPGSPAIAQKLTRKTDKLVFCEKHPAAFAALKARFSRDRRVKTLDLDGWTALGAFAPPPERRGLVLIDPPYEERDEFSRMSLRFSKARAKWDTGLYALWYPVKVFREAEDLWKSVCASGARSALRLELAVAPAEGTGLRRTGLIIVNPPYVLEAEARAMAPALVHLLERAPGLGDSLIESFGG
ncbi:MAG: 23S rRNA (adenine(2030)-N(6))-methyltransferase RlmJ [Rhodoblastus sp.]